MALDFQDQVSATRSATRTAAKRARKQAHQTVDAARAVGLHEPAQVAKSTATRAAKRAAKATARAAGRKSKRAASRRLRVIVIAVVAGGMLALALAAFRRARAVSSPSPTDATFDRFDAVGGGGAKPEARSAATKDGATPVATMPTAKSTPASKG
jgi:hypothetical protein